MPRTLPIAFDKLPIGDTLILSSFKNAPLPFDARHITPSAGK
jgi:hypothetical protein